MKKIIYDNNGNMAIVVPAQKFVESIMNKNGWNEEQALMHIGDKDLPTGTKYSVVSEEELKAVYGVTSDNKVDDTFFDAWEYVADETSLTSNDLSQEDLNKYNMTEQYGG